MIIRAGFEFHWVDGQGYRLTEDVRSHDLIKSSQFQQFGGAPEPLPSTPLPQWLENRIATEVDRRNRASHA